MPAATHFHINYKDICAVVCAADYWAHLWHGKTVIIHTDSTVTKSVINKWWSRNACVNHLLRKMAWSCAKLNCKLKAVHVAGAMNILPDTISRLHEKERSITWLNCSATGTTVLSHNHTCRTPFPLKLFNTWLPGAAATLSKQLDQEVALNRGAAFSDNTKKTYQPHLRSYIAFCEQSGIVPVPASDVTVAKYAAFLAQRKGLLPLSNTWILFACCIWSVT